MATTPSGAFNEFATRIALTDAQRQTLQARRATVDQYLKNAFSIGSDMPLVTTKLIGSAGRGTVITPLNDIDLMAQFSAAGGAWDKYRRDSQAFLYRIRQALNSSSAVNKIGARGQAVRFFYTDGIHVDVAPVFNYDGTGYGLPDGTGGWLTTDPDVHESYINRRNQELGGHLKPLVRKLKCWNRAHSSRLASFHLEVLTATTFNTLGDNSLTASHVFFEAAYRFLSVQDPAGHSGDLSAYLTWQQRNDVAQSFLTARDHAAAAIAAENRGNHQDAIRQWRIVFGDEFPAYG